MDIQKAYRVLYDTVSRGFDTVGVSYGSLSINFKTLTPHERDMIAFYSLGRGLDYYRSCRLAFSVFTLNGENMLLNRESHIKNLTDFFYSTPKDLFEVYEEVTYRLQRRLERYSMLSEGFSYSPRARYLWKERRGQPLPKEDLTGIAGTNALGKSHISEVWSLINMALDTEEEESREINRVMFLASSNNPKGVKKIRANMDTQNEMKENERKSLIEFGSEAHKRIIKHQNMSADQWSSELLTVEDIVEELERQMHGVKDKHDLFMEDYFEKVRLEKEKEKEERQKQLEELRRNRAPDPEVGSFEVTDDDLDKIKSGTLKRSELPSRDPSKIKGRRIIGPSHRMR